MVLKNLLGSEILTFFSKILLMNYIFGKLYIENLYINIYIF